MTLVFPTAATTLVFINGLHLDQAYRIDWKESAPRVPLYGYNDYYFRALMRGKSLVQGFLVINFLYPGYLSAVIKEAAIGHVPVYDPDTGTYKTSFTSEQEKKEFVFSHMPPNTPEGRLARAEYIANLLSSEKYAKQLAAPGRALGTTDAVPKIPSRAALSKKELKKILLENFQGKSIDRRSLVQISTPTEMASDINIDIYYRDPERSLWYVRLENVQFSEISQTITCSSEGSSESLYEVNEFICQRRKIVNLSG